MHYDRTSEAERFIEWSKSINLLTIDPIQRLQQENQDLRTNQAQEIAQLRAELKEWDKVKTELLNLKDLVEDQKVKETRRYHSNIKA